MRNDSGVHEEPYFCNKCGRVLLTTSPQVQFWLVSAERPRPRVVRCPQHITDWAMRSAKMKRSKANYKWKRLAKEQDNPPESLAIEPFF